MKGTYALALALAPSAFAFPSAMNALFDESAEDHIEARQVAGCSTSALCNKPITISNIKVNQAAVAASRSRDNCGRLTPCTTFDEKDQRVSTSGKNQFISPKAGQIRGPCPGLNAAANHAYLPRSGVATIAQTITGLADLYNMAVDLSGFLAAYAVVFDGDLVSNSWSIGGPPPYSGVGSPPQGISWSHNKYEGDSSIGRCDAYTNNGDAHSLSTQRFKYAFESGRDNNRYTFDKFAQEFAKNTERSVRTNALYFAPLFSTTLVSPAAYNFVIAFMSNHSAAQPGGYLNGRMFKEFFAIGGTYPNFKWLPGQERIPENWYRRPSNAQYAIKDVFGDLLPEFLAYPDSFRFGGNVGGKTNTYTGVDLADFSNGAVNASTIFEGNNFACFVYQNIQQGAPDQLKGLFNPLAEALAALTKATNAAFGGFTCPQVGKFKNNKLDSYDGRKYSPKGGSNIC